MSAKQIRKVNMYTLNLSDEKFVEKEIANDIANDPFLRNLLDGITDENTTNIELNNSEDAVDNIETPDDRQEKEISKDNIDNIYQFKDKKICSQDISENAVADDNARALMFYEEIGKFYKLVNTVKLDPDKNHMCSLDMTFQSDFPLLDRLCKKFSITIPEIISKNNIKQINSMIKLLKLKYKELKPSSYEQYKVLCKLNDKDKLITNNYIYLNPNFKTLKPISKFIILDIKDRYVKSQPFQYKITDVSEVLGLSIRSVISSISELEKKGFIKCVRKTHTNTKVYILC